MKKAQVDDPFYFLLSIFLVSMILFSVYSAYNSKREFSLTVDYDSDISLLNILKEKILFEKKISSIVTLSLNQALQEYYQRHFFSECEKSITGRNILNDNFKNCIPKDFSSLNSFLEKKILEDVNKNLNFTSGIISPFDSVDFYYDRKILVLKSNKPSLFFYLKKDKNYFLAESLKEDAPILSEKLSLKIPLPDSYLKLNSLMLSLAKENPSEKDKKLQEEFYSKLSYSQTNFCSEEKTKLYNLFLDLKNIIESCSKEDNCFCGSYNFKNLNEELYFNNNEGSYVSFIGDKASKSIVFNVGFSKTDSESVPLYKVPPNNVLYHYEFKNIKTPSSSNNYFKLSNLEGTDVFNIPIKKNVVLYFYNIDGQIKIFDSEQENFKSCSYSYSQKKISTFISDDLKNFASINPIEYDDYDYNIRYSFLTTNDFKFSIVSDVSLKDKGLFLKSFIERFFRNYFEDKNYDFKNFKVSFDTSTLRDKNVFFIAFPKPEVVCSNSYNSDYGVDTACYNYVKDFYYDLYNAVNSNFESLINSNKIVPSNNVCVDFPLSFSFFNREAKLYDEKSFNYNFFKVYPHVAVKKNFVWPFEVDHIPQCYGPPPENSNLGYSFHAGIDLVPLPTTEKSKIGSEEFYNVNVKNVFSGKVLYKNDVTFETSKSLTFANPFGESIVVYDDYNNIAVLYGHLKSKSIPKNIKVGYFISTGTVIGKVGNTGNSHGAHLHLEFFKLSKNESDILLECSTKGFDKDNCGYDNFGKWYDAVVFSKRFEKTVNPLCILDSKVPMYKVGVVDFLKTNLPDKISSSNLGTEASDTGSLNPESWSYNCILDYYAAYYNQNFESFYSCKK